MVHKRFNAAIHRCIIFSRPTIGAKFLVPGGLEEAVVRHTVPSDNHRVALELPGGRKFQRRQTLKNAIEIARASSGVSVYHRSIV